MVTKTYDTIFATAPRLKLEDIKVGMRVIGYQLENIKGIYITLDNTEYVRDIVHNTEIEGTITRISEDKNWGTSDTSVLIYNHPFDMIYHGL